MRKFIYITLIFGLLAVSNCFSQVNAYFTADTLQGCGSVSVTFTDTSQGIGINYWEWDFDNDGNVDSYLQNPLPQNYGPGTHSVKLTVSDGTNTNVIVKSNYIVVHDYASANFDFIDSTFYHYSYAVLFSDESAYIDTFTYTTTWDFGDGTVLSTDSVEIIHVFPDEGSYNVTLQLEDDFGCIDTIVKVIKVEDELKIPNVFTPNGDGINDLFTVITNGETVYEFVVYSRWGMILFKSVGNQISWDGRTSAGVRLRTGTYFYTINAVSSDSNVSEHGTLQLVITK